MSRGILNQTGITVMSDMTITPKTVENPRDASARPKSRAELMAFRTMIGWCSPECRSSVNPLCTKCKPIGNYAPLHYSLTKLGLTAEPLDAPMKNVVDYQKLANGTPRPLRESQRIPFAVIVRHLKTNSGIHVNLPTGFGKTEIAVKTALFMGLKTIILVTKKSLQVQWQTTIDAYGPEASSMFVVVLPRSFRTFAKQSEYELLIVDEMHEHCTMSSVNAILLMNRIKRVMCLTATPGYEATPLWGFAEALAGEQKVTVKTDKKYEVIIQAVDLVAPNINSIVHRKSGRMTNSVNYCETLKSIVFHEKYVQEVLQTVIDELLAGNKIMLLCEFAKQVEMFAFIAEKMKIDHDIFYKSLTTYRDTRLLIGTVDKMSTGFDEVSMTKGECEVTSNVLIICSSFKKDSTLQQIVGRVFRNDAPKIYQFSVGNEILKKHIAFNQNFFSSYGFMTCKSLPKTRVFHLPLTKLDTLKRIVDHFNPPKEEEELPEEQDDLRTVIEDSGDEFE